jgi:UDP-2-acetamido-3-amino-2,3-dideoxy-glucuronate N-acetyltransferase
MSKEDKNYFVHESSYVDEPCSIGEETRIWHFSHIMQDCVIGKQCNIGQNVVISPNCTVGDNVKIQNNVSIYTGVILEDDVFCGPSAVFTNVINPRSHVPRKDEYKEPVSGPTLPSSAEVPWDATVSSARVPWSRVMYRIMHCVTEILPDCADGSAAAVKN